MTFETWAKELLCKELKNQGEMFYIRKPSIYQGWYCLTPTGFLLRVKPEKISYGFFRFNYEIMPLVGRIVDAPKDYPHALGVTMEGCFSDTAYGYAWKFSHPFGHKSTSLRTKKIEEDETKEIVLDMIHNFLNPLFDSLTSYENYCKALIEIRLYPMERNEIKRRELVKRLFDHGVNAGVDRGEFCRSEFPIDYPWFADRINQMPYVYALLGKFDEALAMIRGIRKVRLGVIEFNYEIGTYTNRMDDYLKAVQDTKSKNHEIETAMQEKDIDGIRNILEANYQRNRELIYERIGFEIPETCPVLP